MNPKYKHPNKLPMTLSVMDVANALGISRVNAYNLCHVKGFPAIRLGKRILIPKDRFLCWMDKQEVIA